MPADSLPSGEGSDRQASTDPSDELIGWMPTLLPALGALGVALFVLTVGLWHNWSAVFGPIDDHEPLGWLQGEARLSPTDYLSTLLTSTEVGDFTDTPRFRPLYYAVRVGEAVLFGAQPTGWYVVVAFVFVITTSVLGYTAALWLNEALDRPRSHIEVIALAGYAGLSTLLFAALPAWSGIVTRLGPAEQWALLGSALAALALTRLAIGGSGNWWWFALGGTALAVLSKENFAVLALLPVGIGVYRYRIHTRAQIDCILGFLALVPVAVLAAGVGPGLMARSGDVYGQDIDASRAGMALQAFFDIYLLYWAPAFAVVTLAIACLWFAHAVSRVAIGLFAYLVAVGLLWLLADSFMYAGVYSLPRYWAVFQGIKVAVVLGAVAMSVAGAHRGKGIWRAGGFVSLSVSLLLLANIGRTVPASIQQLAGESRANADATVQYRSDLGQALLQLQGVESPRVLVVTRRDVDFEPVVAVVTELTRAYPASRITLKVAPGTSAPALQALSETGNATWNIAPLAAVEQGGNNLCIFINMEPTRLPACTSGSDVRVDARAM